MTATDIADRALAGAGDDDTTPTLFVCHYELDGAVCGSEFDSKVKWNSHCMSKHRVTWDGKPVAQGGRKPANAPDEPAVADTKTPPKGKTAEQKATAKATARPGPTLTNDNRAATYEQSLGMIGMLAHLSAGRWFDDYDLNVWTSGAKGLANGLDAVGAVNPGMRRACDLILAGGGGGPYVQLIMAAGMIAVPIAAHHGMLPEATGQRFAAMIGVMGAAQDASPGPVQQPAPAPGPEGPSNQLPIEHWTYDDWRQILFAAQSNPTAIQAIMDVMSSAGVDPTVVTIPNMPGTEPMNIPEDNHRGSTGTNGAGEPVQAQEGATGTEG